MGKLYTRDPTNPFYKLDRSSFKIPVTYYFNLNQPIQSLRGAIHYHSFFTGAFAIIQKLSDNLKLTRFINCFRAYQSNKQGNNIQNATRCVDSLKAAWNSLKQKKGRKFVISP